MAVDVEVLFECLNRSFAKSICLRVVGSGESEVYIELLVQLFEEFGGKLQTTVGGNMSWETI